MVSGLGEVLFRQQVKKTYGRLVTIKLQVSDGFFDVLSKQSFAETSNQASGYFGAEPNDCVKRVFLFNNLGGG